MNDDDTTDTTPAEQDAGRDALRELGAPPLPRDVLARLEGRLAGEPGLAAPVRRGARRRRARLVLVAPGFGIALAAVVAVAVITTHGSSPRPAAAPRVKAFEKSSLAAPAAQGTAGSRASDAAALVRVPALVGRSYPEARALALRLGLRLVPAHAGCTSASASTISAQTPRAGARIAGTSAIRVRQRCRS